MKERLLPLCSDLDFDSTSYALRENRYLKACSGDTLRSDLQNGAIHFQDFKLIAMADHPTITKRLIWPIEIGRKKDYCVDFVDVRDRATTLDKEYRLSPKIPFNDIVEHLALNHVLTRLKYHCRLEKRKGTPSLCIYKAETLLENFPLNPIELAWLAKL